MRSRLLIVAAALFGLATAALMVAWPSPETVRVASRAEVVASSSARLQAARLQANRPAPDRPAVVPAKLGRWPGQPVPTCGLPISLVAPAAGPADT